eukprot:TRINITY_DN7050_c0_g2_i2.p1 TRINITY_DN7050_c0_g2~~TRINITY_DN7050_c0_g2_i2.p1  ORF type:complete len:238 (+),score=6.33 TRINITY_DN7050_c0_g2_i2:22-735(+)
MAVMWLLVLCTFGIPLVNGRRFYDTDLPIISEVAFQHEPVSKSAHAAQAFVGSPSYVQTAPKHYLASHDRFFNANVGVTYVYFSTTLIDWQPVANVTPMYWGQLFNVGNTTYIMGTSGDTKGDWVISRCLSSPCNGAEWSKPAILFPKTSTVGYHCAPTPVVNVDGTLYRAIEKWDTSQPGNFGVTILSSKDSCDLLSSTCWTVHNLTYLHFDTMVGNTMSDCRCPILSLCNHHGSI